VGENSFNLSKFIGEKMKKCGGESVLFIQRPQGKIDASLKILWERE